MWEPRANGLASTIAMRGMKLWFNQDLNIVENHLSPDSTRSNSNRGFFVHHPNAFPPNLFDKLTVYFLSIPTLIPFITKQVLATIKQNGPAGGPGDDRVKMVRQEYQKKLSRMEEEVKKLKTAQKEHAKLMKERSAHERQLKSLKAEMADMKRNKVKVRMSPKATFNHSIRSPSLWRRHFRCLLHLGKKKEKRGSTPWQTLPRPPLVGRASSTNSLNVICKLKEVLLPFFFLRLLVADSHQPQIWNKCFGL